MLNILQSIAHEYHYQLLDSPETDSAQYISNHPGIERLSEWYRVDVSYPETQLTYSRLTWRIQLSISSLMNDVLVHLRSTLMLSLMVSDLTLHTDAIERSISTSRHSLLPDIPTLGRPLNRVYALRITVDWFILLHSKHIFFIPECFESVVASTHRVSSFRH